MKRTKKNSLRTTLDVAKAETQPESLMINKFSTKAYSIALDKSQAEKFLTEQTPGRRRSPPVTFPNVPSNSYSL